MSAAAGDIGRYVTLYNSRRPHLSLTDRTPVNRPGIAVASIS